MIQDAPVAGTPLSVDLLARMAKELANIRYFRSRWRAPPTSCAA